MPGLLTIGISRHRALGLSVAYLGGLRRRGGPGELKTKDYSTGAMCSVHS